MKSTRNDNQAGARHCAESEKWLAWVRDTNRHTANVFLLAARLAIRWDVPLKVHKAECR